MHLMQKPGIPAAQLRKLLTPFAAVTVGLITFVVYEQSLLARWYAGPFIFDYGWFNDLLSGRTLDLGNPSGVDDGSFYAMHVAPLLALLGEVSRLLQLKGGWPAILFLSLGFAAAAVMAFVIIARLLRPAGAPAALAGGVAGALAYAFNGVMRSTANYPHFEIFYVPLALLTLVLLFQRRFVGAWIALAFCLLVREDAGLQLACILGAYLALSVVDERAIPSRLRELAPFLGAMLVYPLLAIVWQRTAFPSSTTFQAIYTGDPPFAHLNRTLVSTRIHLLLGASAWITLVLAASLSVLPFHRRWVALTGAAASLPWLLLNSIAYSQAAGGLQLYYAFPFLVTALAPLIVEGAAALPPREERLDVVAL